MSEYPQLVVRLPTITRDRIVALARVTGLPQWRVLSEAVEVYIAGLSADRRALLESLLQRAEPLLSQPIRSTNAPTVTDITVLNVDDNDPMRFARSAMLRGEGFTVVEAATGRAALEAMEKCNPRVVLLDVNLPDMSGLDVCRRIKSDSRWDHVRIVQTSATFSSPHDQLDGLQTGGADIYLAEPVPRGTLLSIVRRLAALS